MKTILNLTLVLFCHLLFAQDYKGDSWQKVKSAGSGTLTIVYFEQSGLIYESDGKVRGVCADIVSDFQKYVEKMHGKKVNVQYAARIPDFASFLKTVQNSENVLGVTNATINEERKKILKFTPPFMTTQVVLLTNKNSPTIKTLAEIPKVFNGFTAQVITGSTHVQYLDNIKKEYYPGLKVSYAPSGEEIVKNLSADPKLFSILDFTEYIGVVRKKLPVKRQEVDMGVSDPLGFIMSKQSDWDVLWNEFLTEEYRKSVRYKEIVAANLGSSFLSLVR